MDGGDDTGRRGENPTEARVGVVDRLRARQEEIERAIFGLSELSRTQAALLDRLVIGVTREYGAEMGRAGRSREHRLLERVRLLLAGEPAAGELEDASLRALGAELEYDLEAEHLGVIARGAGAREVLVDFARSLDRRLLSVAHGRDTIWGWLGGRGALAMGDLQSAFSEQQSGALSLALGEPARGFQGWRLTHRQAQAALVVALRRPQPLTRYADVALLATAIKDRALAKALIDSYLAPLEDRRSGAPALCETLRAYMTAECNTSSAAAALGVARRTVESRLRTTEERLGRKLHPCPAELEIALLLDELGVITDTNVQSLDEYTV